MPITRRGFLSASGGLVGLCLTSGCSSGGGLDGGPAEDLASPPDLPGGDLATCAGTVDGGPAAAVGLHCATLFAVAESYGFFLCRDAGGLYAVTGICTHAGCLIGAMNSCSSVRTPSFLCPCHGSLYAYDGTLIQGVVPGQASLDHLALCITAEGRCVVDPNTVVDPSTRA